MTRPATASSRKKPQRVGATVREQAMALLAEGLSIAEVSRRLGLHRRTVEKWRTTTAGAAALETAKEQASEAFQSTVEAARSKLSAAAVEATDVLLAVLRDADSDPGSRLRAASMIFDRVGLPRTQRLETPPAPLDTSKLSPEQLDQLDALLAVIGAP
ncbi:MAG: helix-turn-helix domain-containing protein [Myxococcaceae bacterium]|nr:MAG: helix-turn-helix domain-containing protein [Myxococcaceae bacterium]